MRRKLSRKLFVQWYMLKLCKEFPRTKEEILEAIQNDIPLPWAAKPTFAKDTKRPMHSAALLRRYLKELEKMELLIHANDAFSITRKGYEEETSLRLHLRERLRLVLRAVEKMNDDLNGKPNMKDVQIVPESDREFLRGVISVKDMVRYFALDYLLKNKKKPLTITNLREEMLQKYGWTCSKQYFFYLIRDELGDGQLHRKPEQEDFDPALANCVKGRWDGELRNERYYSITSKGMEWIDVFRKAAKEQMHEAILHIDLLLKHLD